MDVRDREEVFELFWGAYHRAEKKAGSRRWFGRLGDRVVELRSAGAQMFQLLLPALAHRQCPSQESADLTVALWDSQSSGCPLPFLPSLLVQQISDNTWSWLGARHEIKGLNDSRFGAVYRLGPQVNLLSLLDRHTSRAIYWLEDASLLPYWETSSPLQIILNWWAECHHLQYIHAAAVGFAQGAVVLTGAGGSGKSSTALACLDSDLGYLADDYCLISLDPPNVYSLYATAKLIGAKDFERFPRLAAWVTNPERGAQDKAVLDVYRHQPEKLVEKAPIRAVVVPKVREGTVDSELKPLSGSRALMALAPSTLFQLSGTHQSSLSRMAQLLRQVPCYSLLLGSDIRQLPGLLATLLEDKP